MNPWPDDWFAQFWSAYPRRVAKKTAWLALERVRRANEVEWERFIEAVKTFAQFCRGRDPQYIPHPSTWINGGRWDDELTQPVQDTAWKLSQAMQETLRRRMQ